MVTATPCRMGIGMIHVAIENNCTSNSNGGHGFIEKGDEVSSCGFKWGYFIFGFEE